MHARILLATIIAILSFSLASPVQAQCPVGLLDCAGNCVDIQKDEENCGSCGNQCPAGHICSNGSCVLSCQAGLVNCGGVCVDLFSDENHCGQCAFACPSGQICVSGSCTLSCPLGTVQCGGSCVDLNYDPNHCGGCGQICPSGNGCLGSTCVDCQAPVSVEEVRTSILRARLDQNEPNPFNPSTTIRFSLTEDSKVSLRIYDLAGRLVRTVESERFYSTGEHVLSWDGKNDTGETIASGVYVYRLTAGEYVISRRLTLLK